MKRLDAPGFAKKAKQVLQVDGVAEELEGEIQKLSSLVGRLKVRIKSYCQVVKFEFSALI